MSKYIEIATKAAKKAGEYLLENKGKISREKVDEKAKNDFVTYVDHQSEKIIVDTIMENFPEHSILAEEGTVSDKEQTHHWIIDPLDGTKNFIQDVPFFCVSIALQKQGEIVAGVVYDPVHKELFSASKCKGAYCNGEPIAVSQKDFSMSLIATGFPFRAKYNLPSYLLAFEEIFLACSGMRRCGSAALDLCYAAMGRFEGFWELGLSPWDIAAGSLLIQEAGGKVSDFWGDDDYLESGYVIAGNNAAQKKLLEIIRQHFPNKLSNS